MKEALLLAQKISEEKQYNRFFDYFTDTGPNARSGYKKHVDIINATKTYRELALMGGNRSGKTHEVCWLASLWAHQMYPDWYDGVRYSCPIKIMILGDIGQQVRDDIQVKLLGNPGQEGTGLLPRSTITDETGNFTIVYKQGSGRFVDYIKVKCANGGYSYIYLMSYEQGRKAVQGKEANVLIFNEEPPHDVYSEGVTRTAVKAEDGTDSRVLLAFTPLNGLSTVAMRFLENGQVPKNMKYTYVCQIGWEDVPHLDEDTKKFLISCYLPHEIEARTKGIPCAGAGAVYPIPDSQIAIEPFRIPVEWPRFYSLDYSPSRTAAGFYAINPVNDQVILYECCTFEKRNIAEIILALRARGADWMCGVSDTYGNIEEHSSFIDTLRNTYKLDVIPARKGKNSILPGIQEIYHALLSDQLKVFSDQKVWFFEKNIYQYDEDDPTKTTPKKGLDDHMDQTRYGYCFGRFEARVHPLYIEDVEGEYYAPNDGRDEITGY